MKPYGKVLKTLRLQHGYDQKYIFTALNHMGIQTAQPQVSRWENNRNNPNLEQFLGLCKIYDIHDPYAIFEQCEDKYLSQQQDITKIWGRLNREGQQKLEEYAQLLFESDRYSSQSDNIICFPERTLPLYDIGVSAGTGQFLDSPNYEMISVPDEVPNTATFALRVCGNSMEPTLEDGELIWVHQQPTLENGEIGIFLVNGDAYVKEYRKNAQGVFLISHNRAYSPIQINEYTESRIFGRVVYPV